MQVNINKEILNTITSTKLDIYLWGCSIITEQTLKDFQNKNLICKGIIDNFTTKKEYYNIKVFPIDKLSTFKNSILIIQGNHCLDIYHQLKLFSLPNLTIIFDFNNGGDKLVQTKNLYFNLEEISFDKSVKNIFLSSSLNIELQSYSYIKKVLKGGNFLINFDNLKDKYSDDINFQDTLTKYLIDYINKQINIKNLYIGCGEDYKKGYIHSDLRALDHVDIVCNAWDLSNHIQGLKKLYTRHMLEHLCEKEAFLALKDWYKSICSGGQLELIVPNFDLRAKQWLESKWEDLDNRTEDEIWSVAGCWGWQRECNPREDNYNQTYWDVHKSGYNEKRITMLLKKVGFINIKTNVDEKNNLIAFAYKE